MLAAAAGSAEATQPLCKANPYTKDEATQGRALFDSHCALCHQYSMAGRQPGNADRESPKLDLLTKGDLEFMGNNGDVVPPLIGRSFFDKMQVKSVADFSSTVGSAAISFPPAGKVDTPYTYLKIAAYVLYRNCGKL
jgi:mono/diheme cytochrome c family protein